MDEPTCTGWGAWGGWGGTHPGEAHPHGGAPVLLRPPIPLLSSPETPSHRPRNCLTWASVASRVDTKLPVGPRSDLLGPVRLWGALDEPLPKKTPPGIVVHHADMPLEQQAPTFQAPGTDFVGSNFSTDQDGEDGFGMIQAHHALIRHFISNLMPPLI